MLSNKKKQVINLEKGKRLYYEYYGNKFGMWHDLGSEYTNCNVPKEIENEWKADILNQLNDKIQAAQGSELVDAISQYIHLLPASPEWLMQFLLIRETDTFTAIIFCEQLKNMMNKPSVNKRHIRRFLDEFKVKLLKEPITIHESYKNDSYMQDYDFSDNHIKMRIEAI